MANENSAFMKQEKENDPHREIRDPGGATRDLKKRDEGAVEDGELDGIWISEERHPDDRICKVLRRG